MKLIFAIGLIILCISCSGKDGKINNKPISENEVVLSINNIDKEKTEEMLEKINTTEQKNLKNLPTDEFLASLRWYRGLYSGGYSVILRFNTDETYSLFMTRGLGIYAIGNYEIINENEVLLRYPVEFPSEITSVVLKSIEDIFNKNDLLLELDREYMDFYNMYRLFSEKELFVSEISSPEGNEYIIDNANVLKTNGRVKILDIVNMKKEPSIDAPLAGYSFMYRFHQSQKDSNIIVNFVVPYEEFKYEAISINIDEIDTYRKPWYRIVVEMEEYEFSAWVYGGYVEEISKFNYNLNYTGIINNIIRELINRGYVSEEYFEDND